MIITWDATKKDFTHLKAHETSSTMFVTKSATSFKLFRLKKFQKWGGFVVDLYCNQLCVTMYTSLKNVVGHLLIFHSLERRISNCLFLIMLVSFWKVVILLLLITSVCHFDLEAKPSLKWFGNVWPIALICIAIILCCAYSRVVKCLTSLVSRFSSHSQGSVVTRFKMLKTIQFGSLSFLDLKGTTKRVLIEEIESILHFPQDKKACGAFAIASTQMLLLHWNWFIVNWLFFF